MSVHIEVIPIFSDNYVFIIYDEVSRMAVVVDPGEARAVIQFLTKNNLQLKTILLTHQHDDHVGGVGELQTSYGAQVYGPNAVTRFIPCRFNAIDEGARLKILDLDVEVLNVEGHTLGHVAYDFKSLNSVFVGDALFGLGCGRIFEGDFEMTFNSLNKFKNLHDEYKVYCAHEYTGNNIKFCEKLIADAATPENFSAESFLNYKRDYEELMNKSGRSIPLSLNKEKSVNPFLKVESVEEFSRIRQLRNKF